MNQPVFTGFRPWIGPLALWAAVGVAAPPAAAPPAADAKPAAAPRKPAALLLETTDGLELHAWHYPAEVPEGGSATATVILLHDLEGSHESLEPLALELQAAGCDVVAPDLRGHGASTARPGGALDVRSLKKTDFEMMAAARGGQIREQSATRGDVEAVRNWIKGKAENRELGMDPLFVVGSGLGAAIAAAWTAEDASWPAGTKGKQGRQVRGVVLISPTWTTRGFSISGPLGNEALKTEIPLLLIAGTNDRDAEKLFEQLKRQRPTNWLKQRVDGETEKAARLEDRSKATLFLVEVDSANRADALATDKAVAPHKVIGQFFKMVLGRPVR